MTGVTVMNPLDSIVVQIRKGAAQSFHNEMKQLEARDRTAILNNMKHVIKDTVGLDEKPPIPTSNSENDSDFD